MVKLLDGPDALSGKEGYAYIQENGRNIELFQLKKIEAKLNKHKAAVKAVGLRMDKHKTTGIDGTGSMTIYFMSSYFQESIKSYQKTGRDLIFNLVIWNDDPASDAGKQTIQLIDCTIDGADLAKLDGASDDPLEEDVDFTFDDFSILEDFNEL